MDRIELAPHMNPHQLQLIILPTEQCNFRCTYCYEDFEIGMMKRNTVLAIKKLIENRLPRLDYFALSWFGGEPLMAKAIVTELNAFAQRECAAAGVEFAAAMTTNAFGLDRDTFDQLVALDIRDYQISIDGDESEHNKTRKLVNGKGSFARIWSNLLALRSSPETFKIMLRVHVHKDNVDSIRALLPKMQDAFGDDPRFTIFMKAVGNWGGDSVKSMDLLHKPEDIIADLKAQLTELGWFKARPVATGGPVRTVTPCYAAKPNSFVIRADGNLAKCTVAFSDPRNRVGQINDDGTLELENDKLRTFMRGFQSLDKSALHCPMKGMPKAMEEKVLKFERMQDILAQPA